jgi:histidinol-phosphate aminotransferase
MSWITALARPEIVQLKSYEHAAWELGLERLHANELPWRAVGDESGAGLNRYPEPQPRELVQRLAELYGVEAANLLVGRGSDEMIDLLVRVFCRAGEDSVLICPPTFGMYAVSARIQGAQVLTAPLAANAGFRLDEATVIDACRPDTKLVFLCSPNNPTGNLLDEATILRIATGLGERALIVVDEAYIEFAATASFAERIRELPQLVVLRTLSKAHGLAGARCGSLVAGREIVGLLRKVIPPYAIPQLTVEAAVRLLQPSQLAVMRSRVESIRAVRERLSAALHSRPGVVRVWPSAANFVLVELDDADRALQRARSANLLIRDVRAQPGLERAVRISIGTPEQNDRLLEALE